MAEKKTNRSRGRRNKHVIGRLDRVDLPQFQLSDLPCKIDTGASYSAIHCHKVKLVETEGVEMISFYLLDPSHPDYSRREFRTMDFSERRIRSSFGETEYRYVIKTQVRLFGRSFRTEFTLSDREQMKYPVLLGRRLLRKKFLVDVAYKDLSYQQKRNGKKNNAEP